MFLTRLCSLLALIFGVEACTMTDNHCTFYLTIDSRLTLWRGKDERVYINDDESLGILDSNDTASPDDVILADGYERPNILTVVNGSMPGPTLTVYKGQTVTVHVTNLLINSVVTIHWHGIHQRGTQWSDGAGFITQCPILPGQTFMYRFTVDVVGTYFYHSHIGGKEFSGLFGPLIVKERQPDVYPEHVMTVQDYHNNLQPEDYKFRVIYGNIDSIGNKFFGLPSIDGSTTTLESITSSLINGRGRLYDFDTHVNLTNTPFYVFEVEPNRTYRFRLINAGGMYQNRISIDGHDLTIVAMDGIDVEPTPRIDGVISNSGERVDFLVHTNNTVGNYWIRLNGLLVSGDYPGFAILRYNGAPVEHPSTSAKECTSQSKCFWFNCAVPGFTDADCINVDEMRSAAGSASAPTVSSGRRFKEIFMHAGVNLLRTDMVDVRGNMNGVTFRMPTVSALTQSRDVTGKCTDGGYGCGLERTCICLSSFDLEIGDVVQLNIFSRSFGPALVHHPMHLHGYHFHVLKIGYRPTNEVMENMGPNGDIDCQTDGSVRFDVCNNATWTNSSWLGGNVPGIDLSRAPLKDTVRVPRDGYVIVRFLVDNPGLWHLHCHITWHGTFFGMGTLMNVSIEQVPPAPMGFPKCGNFNPDITSTTNEDEPDERTSRGQTIHGEAGILFFIATAICYWSLDR